MSMLWCMVYPFLCYILYILPPEPHQHGGLTEPCRSLTTPISVGINSVWPQNIFSADGNYPFAIHTPAAVPAVLNTMSLISAQSRPIRYCVVSQNSDKATPIMTIFLPSGFQHRAVRPKGTNNSRFSRLPAHTPAFGNNRKWSFMVSSYPGARRSRVMWSIRKTLNITGIIGWFFLQSHASSARIERHIISRGDRFAFVL